MRVPGAGVELCAEVDGPPDAPPVVFLHGVSGSLETYGWLPPRITAGRRIVRVDLRGHGRSDRAPGTYVLDRYGADLVAVLEALGGRPAVLVGHSLGGVVAWSVAQQRPDLVAAAFLEDPPLYLGEPEEHAANGAVPIFRTLLETAAGWHAEGAGVEGAAARLATGPMGESLADDALRSRAQALLQMDPGVLEAAIDGSALAPTDTAAPVAAPMLVLAADDAYGAAFAARHAERLARSHPAVEVLRLRGVGHSIHDDREHRADYVSQLVRFLER